MTLLRVLSLGAGVQSTTLALMAAHGDIVPMPDGAIFADTMWEPQAVYRHLDWLETVLPFPVHRVSAGNIRDGILTRRNTTGGHYAAVPWFIRHDDGTAGLGRRQCTSEYKLKPIMWKVRDLLGVGRRDFIPPESVEQWVGISTDEASRMKPARQRYIRTRWPLIERLMSRDDCLRWLAQRGYPMPPKSACLGCPFHDAQTWKRMAVESPAEFADACEVDAALRQGDARGRRGEEYMHRAMIPLREAVERDVNGPQINLFENECEGMCGL